MQRRTKIAASVLSVTALATAMAGCAAGESGGSGGDAPSADTCQNSVIKADLPLIEVWAWYPEFDSVVDAFNERTSDVQACWVNAGAGAEHYNRVNIALEARSGAPDVIQVESDMLPNFVVREALVDLVPLGAGDVESQYSAGAWAGVSSGDATYAIPVDAGPLGMYYRADIFDQYGIEVPATWAEFADAAQQLQDAGSEAKLTDWFVNQPYFLHGLLGQNGWKPFDFDLSNPTEIGVDIDSPEGNEVIAYWLDLVDRGLVATDDRGTTDFLTNLVTGGYASYIVASWGKKNIIGVEGADPAAVWRAAPLPQWDASDPRQSNFGGSNLGVTSQATDAALAAKVAMGLFGDESAQWTGVNDIKLFPTWTNVLDSSEFADEEEEFFGGQRTNSEVWLPAAQGFEGTTFSPATGYYYDRFSQNLYAAIRGEITPAEVLPALQAEMVTFLESEGYTVR